MTIHSEHPFLPPESDRNPLRRLRGRLSAPVTAWTAMPTHARPVGLTVSSMLVADGDPGMLLGLVDPDSDLYEVMVDTGTVAVSVLGPAHRQLADALAGTAPAPGGPFRIGSWTDTAWGPVLDDAVAWVGGTVAAEPEPAGWAMLVKITVIKIEIGTGADDGLTLRRGRYHTDETR